MAIRREKPKVYKQRNPDRFLLEPGMTVREYYKLKKAWDAKLTASGFTDIEHISPTGQISPFFRDYPTFALSQRFDQSTLDYYLLARVFLDRTDFTKLAPRYSLGKLYHFIWSLHCEGAELRVIELAVKKRAGAHGMSGKNKPKYGTSIFTVHGIVHEIKEAFLHKLRTEPDWFLQPEE